MSTALYVYAVPAAEEVSERLGRAGRKLRRVWGEDYTLLVLGQPEDTAKRPFPDLGDGWFLLSDRPIAGWSPIARRPDPSHN